QHPRNTNGWLKFSLGDQDRDYKYPSAIIRLEDDTVYTTDQPSAYEVHRRTKDHPTSAFNINWARRLVCNNNPTPSPNKQPPFLFFFFSFFSIIILFSHTTLLLHRVLPPPLTARLRTCRAQPPSPTTHDLHL
ncbi:hypothetical protein LINPERPRIM_LOCUS21797, partial [Linum perenne]